MSAHPYGGRHELGQNFLTDPATIATLCAAAARTTGPLLELGAGDGALTVPLSRSGRPITAVELDPRRARHLARRTPDNVRVVQDDLLRHRLPGFRHTVVGNLPFHLTTAALRRLLRHPHWELAVLLVQWEVARRRAGIGGASQLTAAWWPWYGFTVPARVPAHAFRPRPAVDGGILVITRRTEPLVAERDAYQEFVRRVFTGRGQGLAGILPRTGYLGTRATRRWLADEGVRPAALPRELTARQWASLWDRVR
ncbi:23S ribosomal RNA methyltransferase Erm [Amycolatopsis jiangsuensis]|uniref:23S rRNA (Adenine-N6)-dimethyltransferase n=1 Tax=Amycolatopsis jiangsuensis TaxID=1181879 RepID=A0A840IN88_9PSEU|nr:23S ribosomal RNA methyltransferase Erm [Amycolatopsis jiangsuensis]MBB4683410.1 23S rRNA (adenine-N6)-dimethyltransferase [Amycolatopsis jiangsuensis]